MKRTIILCSLFLTFLSSPALQAGSQPTYPAIEGVMGVDPALAESCAAVWIAIPEDKALAGIEWFNNDGGVTFPGLYLGSGVPETPLALDETVLAATDVIGQSEAWSEVTFNQPVTCASEGLYVIFRFPEGQLVADVGLGGGPAIGYVAGDLGAPGWLCSDGESYNKVGGTFGFAVLPVFVDAQPGMMQLMGAQFGPDMAELMKPLVTMLDSPYPNPFNPETVLKYSLAEPENVSLSIYDLRGRLVTRLADEFQDAGNYEVVWKGRDDNNRRMSSGVYFVRFSAGDVETTRRVVMVK